MDIIKIPANYWDGMDFGVFGNTFHGGDRYPEHRHGFNEFFMVEEGIMTHRKNGLNDTMSRRSLCLNYPDDQHELGNSIEHKHVTIVNCTFSDRVLRDAEAPIKNSGLNVPAGGWSRTLKNIPIPMWQVLESKAHRLLFQRADLSPAMQEALFKSMLLDVLLLLAEPEKGMTAAAPEWLVRLREKMQKEENFLVGLERMIALSHHSQEHLTRTMRRFYGETPTELINRLRTGKAARMLLQSRLTMFAVMEECGFNNYAWFLRCFRRYFGMSPQQYLNFNRQPAHQIQRVGRARIPTEE